MRVLGTGGSGFIGSHFIRSWLAHHPADTVRNLDLLTYAGSRERLSDLDGAGHYEFFQADVCDEAAVRQAMVGCDLVAHFAAETHVDRSITNAIPFVRTNIQGTLTVLQAAQVCRVNRIVHISTDEVYGPVLDGAVDERAPLSPRSPYAASKAGGDLLVQAFHLTYGLPAIVVRPTNIFGPAQLPEKFIPLCITHAFDNLPIPIYGDGQQRRAWLFVNDCCEAIRTVSLRGRAGEIYNLAGGTELPNLETARRVLEQIKAPETLLEFVQDRPGHDRRYAMQDAKLRALGWTPSVTFDEGLAETIAWFRQHEPWWRPLVRRLNEDPYHWLNRTAGTSARESVRPVR